MTVFRGCASRNLLGLKVELNAHLSTEGLLHGEYYGKF